jgi:lipoprotein signal peptidase
MFVIPLTALDLLVKRVGSTPEWAYHTRSTSWLVLCFVLLAAIVVVLRVPSKLVPPAAGVLAAGVLGNGLSALASGDLVVPNPLVIHAGGEVVAFNLADIFVFVGLATMLPVLARELIIRRVAIDSYARHNRQRLLRMLRRSP